MCSKYIDASSGAVALRCDVHAWYRWVGYDVLIDDVLSILGEHDNQFPPDPSPVEPSAE